MSIYDIITNRIVEEIEKNDESLKLKKGCKQHMVVFYSTIKDKLSESDNEEEQKKKGFLKYYKVFAIKDVEGLEPRRKIICNNHNTIEEAESLINSYLHRENF